MGLDAVELVIGQLAWGAQDFGIDSCFADIMQQGAQSQNFLVLQRIVGVRGIADCQGHHVDRMQRGGVVVSG